MTRVWLLLPALVSCGIAFGAGTREAPAPQKFGDAEEVRSREEQTQMAMIRPPGTPTFGISFVVGGSSFDGGTLPKPPLPIVKPL